MTENIWSKQRAVIKSYLYWS